MAPGGGRHPRLSPPLKRPVMHPGTILLAVFFFLLFASLPIWPHTRNWGYRPTGSVAFGVLMLLLLVISTRI